GEFDLLQRRALDALGERGPGAEECSDAQSNQQCFDHGVSPCPARLAGRRENRKAIPGQAGTRPPKNGASISGSAWVRPEVKIISGGMSCTPFLFGPSRSTTRRAIAGAGSIHATGHGASAINRSSSSG